MRLAVNSLKAEAQFREDSGGSGLGRGVAAEKSARIWIVESGRRIAGCYRPAGILKRQVGGQAPRGPGRRILGAHAQAGMRRALHFLVAQILRDFERWYAGR